MPKIILSAQNFNIYQGDNLSPHARTGDTSPEQLVNAGAQGVIIGHSEVGDSSEIIHLKLKTIAAQKLLPQSTVLLGESWDEFENKTESKVAEVISQKTTQIFKGIPTSFLKNLIVGYEPKWGSRGSGRDDMPPPSAKLVSACAKAIKQQLPPSISIIYGGRSTPERTEQILADNNVVGLILGSACNTIAKTLAIAEAMQKVKPKQTKILHANFKAYPLTDSYEQYLTELKKLDNSFIIYLSPPHTDLFKLSQLL